MSRRFLRCLTPVLVLLAAATAARATPQFARQQDASCTACHTVPPMLNENGLAFQADGYVGRLSGRSKPAKARKGGATIPLAAWLTARYEDKGTGGPDDFFLPKVELISGGNLGKGWSYFVEWRVVSLSLASDGTLSDRGGRFEDLFAEWGSASGRHGVKIGQYRSLNQTDVSLRLSADEPVLFRNGVRTGSDADPRVDGLHSFSPSSRSPSLGYGFRSIAGKRASDGLFHFVTVPFVGELSIPLGPEAADSASFELDEAKGVYAETFYRKGLRSVGGHVFFGHEDARLLTLLGSWSWGDFVLTAGAGVDDAQGRDERGRGSVQGEYLLLGHERVRAAFGLRVEDVGDDGQRAAYVPYLAVSAPTTRYTLLLQAQYKNQDGADSLIVDLSALF